MQYVSDNLRVIAARGAMLGFDDTPGFGVHLGSQVAQWLAHAQASVWAIHGQARMSDVPPTHEVISSGHAARGAANVSSRFDCFPQVGEQFDNRDQAASRFLDSLSQRQRRLAPLMPDPELPQVVRRGVDGASKFSAPAHICDVVGKVHSLMLDTSSMPVKHFARPCATSKPLGFSPMKPVKTNRRENLARLANQVGGQAAVAARIGKDRNQVYQWLLPPESTHSRNLGDSSARAIERAFGLSEGWLDRSQDEAGVIPDATPSRYAVVEAIGDEAHAIEFMDVFGSCGGGVLNLESERRAPLLKEPQWFKRYGVKPADALAVWADGDSMADFIVDGDIVIFDRSKKLPRTGKIFLLEHPDGLRIKRLRQQFDKSWVMESNNTDKRRFPDEIVTAEQAEHMHIVGQFIYRQGG